MGPEWDSACRSARRYHQCPDWTYRRYDFWCRRGRQVWFNSGDGNYYATGSGSPQRPLPAATAKGSTPAGVVDSKDEELVQLFPTYNVPAGTGHPAGTSHSIAANAGNNHVFVPLPANNAVLSPDATKNCLTGCVAVFGHPDE